MRALLEAAQAPGYPAKLAVVISNRNEARGLATAEEAGIRTVVVDERAFDTKRDFEAELDAQLRAYDVELICLAGFMRLLSPIFVEAWPDRIINIHPSLLPAFKGLHVHEQVLRSGARISGCTVHFVRAEMDAGPIIAQGAVAVDPQDTPESLEKRVLEQEHRLYPFVVKLLAEGRVGVQGDRVIIDGVGLPRGGLFSPPLEGAGQR
jgi:phosphoribosylglycinamide formyltransferase-1